MDEDAGCLVDLPQIPPGQTTRFLGHHADIQAKSEAGAKMLYDKCAVEVRHMAAPFARLLLLCTVWRTAPSYSGAALL